MNLLSSGREGPPAQGVPEKGTPYASGPGRGSMMNLLSSGGRRDMLGINGLRECVRYSLCFLNVFYVRAYHGVTAALVQAIAVQLSLSLFCVIPDPVCSHGCGDPAVLKG